MKILELCNGDKVISGSAAALEELNDSIDEALMNGQSATKEFIETDGLNGFFVRVEKIDPKKN